MTNQVNQVISQKVHQGRNNNVDLNNGTRNRSDQAVLRHSQIFYSEKENSENMPQMTTQKQKNTNENQHQRLPLGSMDMNAGSPLISGRGIQNRKLSDNYEDKNLREN